VWLSVSSKEYGIERTTSQLPSRYQDIKGDNMRNKEVIDALQNIIDEVFEDTGLLVEIDDERHDVFNVSPDYKTQVSFHINDIRLNLSAGTLEVFVKRNMSEALTALSELILEKVKELDG